MLVEGGGIEPPMIIAWICCVSHQLGLHVSHTDLIATISFRNVFLGWEKLVLPQHDHRTLNTKRGVPNFPTLPKRCRNPSYRP